jgi:hypothetical protein
MQDLKENILEGIHRAHDMASGHYFVEDDLSAGDIAKQRGGEMFDTAKTGAGELKDRTMNQVSGFYDEVTILINNFHIIIIFSG